MNESVSDLGGVAAVASAVTARIAAGAAVAANIVVRILCLSWPVCAGPLVVCSAPAWSALQMVLVAGRSSMAAPTAAVVGRG